MVGQYVSQALSRREEGALHGQLDRACEAVVFAMGLFRMGHHAGNDSGWALRKRRYVEQPDLH
ncbi:hypothetical protein CF641_38810, partial [Burkholderia pseudomallei]